MIKTFIFSFSIKNTYRVNSIIYSLKQIPFLGKLLPESLYQNNGLKILGKFISILIELASIFVGKLFYLSICFSQVIKFYSNPADAFVNIFVFLSLIGVILNTRIFNPTKDKFYAMMLLRLDAKKYTLTDYFYFLGKTWLGFLPLIVFFGLSSNVPIWICFLLPIFVLFVKTIMNTIHLYRYQKSGKVENENLPAPIQIVLIVILLGLAYGLPFFNFSISNIGFLIVFGVALLLGIFCFQYILSFQKYRTIYKQLLTQNNVNLEMQKNNMNQKLYTSFINEEKEVESTKDGYEYFHDIFVLRHKKLLTKASKKISVYATVFFLFMILLSIIIPDVGKNVNQFLEQSLPYFLFIMYFVNRGERITQMMFMNCDHSMLTYRFYRQPNDILKLFRERLKTLIKLNIVPGLIIATGTTILLVFGNASILEHIITFFTILSMSIFFSIHYLVIYYLLQPYNLNLEMKNPVFSFITGMTYFICYMAINIKLPTPLFGMVMIIFTVVYSILSLYLSYRYAPKTFKLRN